MSVISEHRCELPSVQAHLSTYNYSVRAQTTCNCPNLQCTTSSKQWKRCTGARVKTLASIDLTMSRSITGLTLACKGRVAIWKSFAFTCDEKPHIVEINALTATAQALQFYSIWFYSILFYILYSNIKAI